MPRNSTRWWKLQHFCVCLCFILWCREYQDANQIRSVHSINRSKIPIFIQLENFILHQQKHWQVRAGTAKFAQSGVRTSVKQDGVQVCISILTACKYIFFGFFQSIRDEKREHRAAGSKITESFYFGNQNGISVTYQTSRTVCKIT